MRLLILFVLVFVSAYAEAKVFDYNKSAFIAYLSGAYGINKLQKTAYEPGVPSTVTFAEGTVSQSYSADFGLGFTTGKTVTRLGVELLYPQLVKEISGANASGTSLLQMTSEVYSVIPKVAFEFAAKQSQEFKVFVGIAGGYGATVIKNTVNLTSAGLAAFPTAAATYTEEGTAYSIMGEVYSGIEFSFFDKTGFSLGLGYRYLPVTNFSANRAANTVGGALAQGGTLRNVSGGNRTIDLSGVFASATMTIYIR